MYDLARSLFEIKSFLGHNLPTNICVGSFEGAQFLAFRNLDFCDFLAKTKINVDSFFDFPSLNFDFCD